MFPIRDRTMPRIAHSPLVKKLRYPRTPADLMAAFKLFLVDQYDESFAGAWHGDGTSADVGFHDFEASIFIVERGSIAQEVEEIITKGMAAEAERLKAAKAKLRKVAT